VIGPLHATNRDLSLIEDAVTECGAIVCSMEPVADLDAAVALWQRWCEVARDIANIRDAWADAIGEAMPDKRHTALGITVERHKKATRRNWQSEDLLRVVLDTRVVDPETGEAESQLDIIKAVYPLAGYNARLGALKARGIAVDEFCTTEWGAWTLRPYTA